MMRLDTETVRPGPRTARGPVEADLIPIPTLIRVPRLAPRRARGRSSRPTSTSTLTTTPTVRARPIGTSGRRPRRRLRRGVRRSVISTVFLAVMAGLFTIGWTPREGGLPRLALPAERPTVEVARVDDGIGPVLESPSTEPDLGAPVVDAESTVVFPGYLLPDNHRDREEPSHEGS